MIKPLLFLTLCLAAAPAAAGTAEDDAFGEKIRAYLMAHPEVIVDALERLAERQRAEEVKTILAPIMSELASSDSVLRYGAADAPQVIYEFFDYRCAVCRANVGTLENFVVDHPDIAVVKTHLPILSPSSEQAVRYVLAAQALYGDDIYKELHQTLYATLSPMGPARLRQLSDTYGLDHPAIEAAMQAPAITERIDRNRDMAITLGIRGTPTFIAPAGIISGRVTQEDLLAVLD